MKTVNGMDLRAVLETIHQETQPEDEHPDPGAIQDCWNEVFETLDALKASLKLIIEANNDGSAKVELFVDGKVFSETWKRTKHGSITCKNLIIDQMQDYSQKWHRFIDGIDMYEFMKLADG